MFNLNDYFFFKKKNFYIGLILIVLTYFLLEVFIPSRKPNYIINKEVEEPNNMNSLNTNEDKGSNTFNKVEVKGDLEEIDNIDTSKNIEGTINTIKEGRGIDNTNTTTTSLDLDTNDL